MMNLKMKNHFKINIKKNKMRQLLVQMQIKQKNKEKIIRLKFLLANSQDNLVLSTSP